MTASTFGEFWCWSDKLERVVTTYFHYFCSNNSRAPCLFPADGRARPSDRRCSRYQLIVSSPHYKLILVNCSLGGGEGHLGRRRGNTLLPDNLQACKGIAPTKPRSQPTTIHHQNDKEGHDQPCFTAFIHAPAYWSNAFDTSLVHEVGC